MSDRGWFGVGVEHAKTETNIGSLWRTAHAFDASLLFTIGRRYKVQSSDTTKAYRSVPLIEFADAADFWAHIPHDCEVVGVELDPKAKPLHEFSHRERAIYLLGAEDHGLRPETRERCHRLIVVPGGSRCLNVAVAGSIVLWHRWAQRHGAEQAA